MATKQLQLLVVAALVFASAAVNDSKTLIDPLVAKDVRAAFQEALKDEEPLLREEIQKSQRLNHKALVHSHLRPSKDVPAEMSAGESGAWASDFERDVSELVMGLSKGGLGATPMGDSVQKISDLITKDMMPKVLAGHAANQKALDKLAKDLESCSSTKTSELAIADKRKVTYEASSKSHKSCRVTEASLYTENVDCHKEWKAAKESKELKCKAYLEISKKYGESQANQQIVTKAGSEDVESYLTRISSTICGKPGPGKPPAPPCGMLCDFRKYKIACEEATKKYNDLVKKCKSLDTKWLVQRKSCDSIQDTMDGASCKWATETKDACEAYAGCYNGKKAIYDALVTATKSENANKTASQKDRMAEWRGLKRMQCLIEAFADKSVTDAEVKACKDKEHKTDHLETVYPKLPELAKCVVPNLFPTTAEYKKAEFVPLPTLAKGKLDGNECSSLKETSTTPATGSPTSCKCERVSMNGPWTPGTLVKCSNCLDVARSAQKNSCPIGTKLFAPQSRQDWETFIKSAQPLRAPNFIVDITRPFPGCVRPFCAPSGNTDAAMNSQSQVQLNMPLSQRWATQDGSPWWLRSSPYAAPTGDYQANCYLDVGYGNANSVTLKDNSCNYHAKSYYCQPMKLSLTPKAGSPTGCMCKKVELMGQYTAQILIKCEKCLDVYRSKDKNSCPSGTKLFSPRTRADWKTFIASAIPLRSPHWIIDVTRPQNGCGGCTNFEMNSGVAAQATWGTSDGSPWWLRSSKYSQPNGDYTANCYLNLWDSPSTENSVTFDDGNCNFHSRSYYCQSLKTTTTTTTTPPTTTTTATTTKPGLAFVANSDAFKFEVEVKFNKWDGENYPYVFRSSTGAFTFHGMGPAYGANKGKLAAYLITKKGVGGHGRGGGDVMSAKTLTQGQWYKVTVEKTADKLCIQLNSDAPKCASRTVPSTDFQMKDAGTVTWDKGINIEGKNFKMVKGTQMSKVISSTHYCGHKNGGYPLRCYQPSWLAGFKQGPWKNRCEAKCKQYSWCVAYSYDGKEHCALMTNAGCGAGHYKYGSNVAKTAADLKQSGASGYSCVFVR